MAPHPVVAHPRVPERVRAAVTEAFLALQRDIRGREMLNDVHILQPVKADYTKDYLPLETVSHELRTPLTAISGSLGLIVGGALGEIPNQYKQMLDIAHKNSLRLGHLINDLLDMEKIAAGKMQLVLHIQPLLTIIKDSMEATHAYSEQHQVHFTLQAPTENTILVSVDSRRLQQVLTNLLSNAAKFSPKGSEAVISVQQSEHSVRVSVTDQGPGISAEFQQRIFQKFSQGDSSDTRQKGGTGLGLAISKELIERMHGNIGFTTETGQGACFYFDLPVHKLTPE